MRILFLTHYFPPEVNAPAIRTFDHAKAWAANGHEVTIVTCVPNQPQGKIYEGYKNYPWSKEEMDGVKIVRLFTLMTANRGFLRRSLSYAWYMLAATLAAPFLRKTDIVVSTSPQFFCGLAGLFVSRIVRAPWVLEIRDLWPESIVAVGAMRQSRTIRFLEYLERLMYRKSDAIVSVTDSFVEHIVDKGAEPSKCHVIKNGVDLNFFDPSRVSDHDVEALGLPRKFIAAYIGTHGMAHGLDTVLDAAEILREQQNIHFLLVGTGAERNRLLEERDKRDFENVSMWGQQQKETMPTILASVGASLVLLRDQELFQKVIPSKIFESMAMKKPIILGVRGESQKLVEDAGAGQCIRPENAEDLASAVLELSSNQELAAEYGENGRRFVIQDFDRSQLARRYETLLMQTARRSTDSP